MTVRTRTDAYGKELYGETDSAEIIDRVIELATRRRLPPAQVALAWLLHQPGVTAPIIGATRIEHLDEAIGAVEVKLDREEIAYLEEPYRTQPIRGHG
jgi:aryl-alcohol dehydrogenase (NADP+)